MRRPSRLDFELRMSLLPTASPVTEMAQVSVTESIGRKYKSRTLDKLAA